jgi:hypothetical protein
MVIVHLHEMMASASKILFSEIENQVKLCLEAKSKGLIPPSITLCSPQEEIDASVEFYLLIQVFKLFSYLIVSFNYFLRI